MRISRSLVPLTLCALSGLAAAQVGFSNIEATYSMNPGSGNINWIVTPDPGFGSIDFTQNAPAFKIGDSTSYTDGSSTIQYDVTSASPISGFDILIQGDVEDFGRINFGASASSGGSLGSLSDVIEGASYSGGANGAFTRTYHLSFSSAATSFTVMQTLSSDINGLQPPSSSSALVGTVENNFPVPEPASLAALGLGAIGFLRRRRR